MLRFILGTLASVGIVLVAILIEGGNLLSYFALTAFAIALLVPFFAVLAVWSLREWLEAWKDAFDPLGRAEARKAGLGTSAAIWAFSEKVSYTAGFVGFIAGAILILSHLSDPSTLGPRFAIGLTCPLDAALLGLVYRILGARVGRGRG